MVRKNRTYGKLGDRYRYIDAIKIELGCQVCGYKRNVSSLVIHHKEERLKTAKLSKMVWSRAPWSVIDKELENGLVLCENCHTEHHAGDINAHEFEEVSITESNTYLTFDKKGK